MDTKKRHHDRKSIRLRGYDYSQNGAYFVTICVKNRKLIFGDIIDGKMVLNEIGQIIYDSWEWLEQQYNYYEHIIRNDESLYKIRQYIVNNPLQWDIDKNNIT